MGTDQNLIFIQGKGCACVDVFQQIGNVFFCKIRCQISTDDDRRIDDQVQVFHGKGQMVQVIFPVLSKLGRIFFRGAAEKIPSQASRQTVPEHWQSSRSPDSHGFHSNIKGRQGSRTCAQGFRCAWSVPDVSIDHSGIIRRSDLLCGNGFFEKIVLYYTYS